MSDGITDAFREREENPDQEMERQLKLLKYHHKEIGEIIRSFERVLEKKKNHGAF